MREKVLKIIADNIGENKLPNDNDNLADDLGYDSLDSVELTMMLEDEFNISIEDDKAEACKTVKDVVELVEELKGQ